LNIYKPAGDILIGTSLMIKLHVTSSTYYDSAQLIAHKIHFRWRCYSFVASIHSPPHPFHNLNLSLHVGLSTTKGVCACTSATVSSFQENIYF